MTAMTPSHGPTESLTVDLATIRQDPSWPVDPDLVASFRASIRRGEPPLLELSLNRVRLADDALTLEIIDGMHRLEALRLEGVSSHGAKVRAYSPQDAFYARIATSIGKPNELFRQRAERALREGFVRDVAAHLAGATVYKHGIAEDGAPRPTPRTEPLPADPLLALGTILWVHFAAKPEVTEDWERFVLAWLEDIARRLGKTPAWLRDEVLQITALLRDDLPGKPTAERARLLLAIPDDGILRLALARLKAEPKLSTTDLRFALDILGCGPDVGRHSWLKLRGLPEMRSMLSRATLSQLARDYTSALARAEAASRAVRTLPAPLPPPAAPTSSSPAPSAPPPPPPNAPPASAPPLSASRPGVPAPSAPQTSTPPSAGADVGGARRTAEDETHPGELRESTPVFGVVSPKFAGAAAHPATGAEAESATQPPDNPFQPARRLMASLISAWHAYDQRGGDWSRSDIWQDLVRLRTLIDAYLARGASSAPQGPIR